MTDEVAAEGAGPWYTRPGYVFAIICVVNLMNYVDRGIIPGATNEFNDFIDEDLHTDTPDVYLGLLQSSFIIGFMIGSLVFSNLVHHYGRFLLVAVGCTVWILAVCLCGFAYYTKSYTFLLFCRILSGVGEASIQTTIPPWIQQAAPPASRGSWLALFYTAIPVGTALGYAYSSIVAGAVGWQWAFFVEALIMAPFIVFLYQIAPAFPCEVAVSAEVHGRQPSMWEELRSVCSSTLFICISLAYAAQAATLQGLSTFGSAFMMGLGFFDSETAASSVFGVVVSVTGMISTPLGGVLLDWLLKKADQRDAAAKALAAPENQLEAFVLTAEDPASNVEREAAEAVRTVSHADGGGASAAQFRRQLDQIMKLSAIFSALATVAMCMVFFTRGVVAFMLLTALGTGLIFCTYSAINMGVMLSVPIHHRSFAIAINTLLLHAVGDVPAPILVGYIKDALAPGCVADSGNDDDGIASSDACRDDADGLRMTILLTDLWMWWTAIFFALGWYLNKRQLLTFPCARPGDDEDMRSPLLGDDAIKRAAKLDAAGVETIVSDLHARE